MFFWLQWILIRISFAKNFNFLRIEFYKLAASRRFYNFTGNG